MTTPHTDDQQPSLKVLLNRFENAVHLAARDDYVDGGSYRAADRRAQAVTDARKTLMDYYDNTRVPASAAPTVDGDLDMMSRLYSDASVVVDRLSAQVSELRTNNNLMRPVVDAAIAYTVEFKTGMTSEALQRLAVAVNAYRDGRIDSDAANSVKAAARAAVEHLNKDGCWLLSDATSEELEQITKIIADHFSAATTAAPVEQSENK